MANSEKKATLAFLLDLCKPQRKPMLLAGIIGAATIFCNIGLLAASAVLISAAALMPPIFHLMTLIVAVRFFGISRAACRYGERLITHNITFNILTEFRTLYYTRLARLVPGNLGKHDTGKLFSDILANIETLKFFYLRVIATPIVACLVILVSTVFLWQFSPVAALILLLGYIICGLALPWLVSKLNRKNLQGKVQAQNNFQSGLLDYIYGLYDLQTYGADKSYLQDLQDKKRAMQTKIKKTAQFDNVLSVFMNLLANVCAWAALCVSIPLVAAGKLEGIYLAMIFLLVWSAFEGVQPLPLAVSYYAESMEAAASIISSTKGVPLGLTDNDYPAVIKNNAIAFENVTFSYPDQPEPAIANINFQLGINTKLAIIGASGAGKSSIANLLLGFYLPQTGGITIGDNPITEVPPDYLLSYIGILQQQPYFFVNTIKANLLMAKSQASDEELWNALARADLREFVESLPKGLETMLEDNGHNLSGGQRQRLALARLFLREPKVVIVDEALQGLDNITAKAIWESLMAWCENRTLISITHNLTYIPDMDMVAVMKDGKLLDYGTLPELLSRCPYFQAIYELNNQRF